MIVCEITHSRHENLQTVVCVNLYSRHRILHAVAGELVVPGMKFIVQLLVNLCSQHEFFLNLLVNLYSQHEFFRFAGKLVQPAFFFFF